MTIEAGNLVVFALEYRPAALERDDGRVLVETCGPRCGIEVEVRASATTARSASSRWRSSSAAWASAAPRSAPSRSTTPAPRVAPSRSPTSARGR